MDDFQKKQILDKISQSKSILITVSEASGFDGLASGLALYLSIKKLDKKIAIFANSPTVGDAQSLYAVDKINQTKSQKNLIINIANAIKNVDKVTYSLVQDQLKIVVHSFADSQGVLPEDVSLESAFINPDFVIAIGFNSLNNLKKEVTHEQNINSDTFVINVSNLEPSHKFAQIDIVDQSGTSISEIITNLLKELALPVDEDISYNLYTGIKYATDMFSLGITKTTTFEAAQYLIKFGADKASLTHQTQPVSTLQAKRPDQVVPQEYKNQIYNDRVETPLADVEIDEKSQKAWLKPPKIYRGAKSFDSES